ADEYFLETGNAHDIAGVRLLDFDALEPFEVINRRDLALRDLAVAMQTGRDLADLDLARQNFSESDPAEVIAVIEVRNQDLETFAGFGARRGNMFDDGVEQRFHRAAGVTEVQLREAVLGRAIHKWKIQLLIGGVQRNEQFENLVEH